MKIWYIFMSSFGVLLAVLNVVFQVEIKNDFTKYNNLVSLFNKNYQFDMSGKNEPVFKNNFNGMKPFILSLIMVILILIFGLTTLGIAFYSLFDNAFLIFFTGFILGSILTALAISETTFIAILFAYLKDAKFIYSPADSMHKLPCWIWSKTFHSVFTYDDNDKKFILNYNSPITKSVQNMIGVGMTTSAVTFISPLWSIFVE